MERFGYMPRLTVFKRPARAGFTIGMRVDASLPKVLHQNNFDELRELDLPAVCAQLARQMERMGVRVKPESLQRADLSAIHYSKNLPLTDHTRCSMVIKEIAKGSVSRQLDSVKTDYRNDGSAIRFHASSHEVIVYDKLKDLERGKKSDKRTIENHNAVQMDLLDQAYRKPFDVVRIEVRLGGKQKIGSLLKKLGMDRPITLESLFSESLAKAVLQHYWQMITPDMPLLAASGFPSGELYDAIHQDAPNASPAQVLKKVGALAIIQREGMEGLRAHVEQHGDARTWYRVRNDLRGLSLTSHMRYNALRVAEGHLQAFAPLRLGDYRV